MSNIEEPLDVADIITRALIEGKYIKSDSLTQTAVWGLISIILNKEMLDAEPCPVCKGAGGVFTKSAWPTTKATPEPCQACHGKGWVLEKEDK